MTVTDEQAAGTKVVEFTLPRPLSINAKHTLARGQKRVTQGWKQWEREAGWSLVQQKLRSTEKPLICGPYFISIVAESATPGADRIGHAAPMDLGNIEKGLSDYLEKMKIIENDRYAEAITLDWARAEDGSRKVGGNVHIRIVALSEEETE